VRLNRSQLRELEVVLERIADGTAPIPRSGGSIGRFLRAYSTSRDAAVRRLLVDGAQGRSVSGRALMPIDVVPIAPLQLTDAGPLAGSATVGVVASETLAATLRITLWGSGRTANWLERTWRKDATAAVQLSGTYRWHPPERITAGGAEAELLESCEWHRIRCLKFTGDDIGREPKAASCHIDWSNAPLGVKAYRSFAVYYDERWRVAPGLREAPADIEVVMADELTPRCGLGLVLAWAQPWEPTRWRVIASRDASGNDVLAHSISWADHVRELRGEPPVTGEEMRALATSARGSGINDVAVEHAARGAAVVRRVDPGARAYAAWLRGVE
jgi:hypothetical protein